MLASRLASCAATKASVARPSSAFAILVSTSSGSPSTVESREASALASALPTRAASRAAVVTAPRRAAAHLGGSVHGRPEMVASLLASSEASAAAVTAPRRALTTLVSTSSGVILAAMSRECWSTTVLRP